MCMEYGRSPWCRVAYCGAHSRSGIPLQMFCLSNGIADWKTIALDREGWCEYTIQTVQMFGPEMGCQGQRATGWQVSCTHTTTTFPNATLPLLILLRWSTTTWYDVLLCNTVSWKIVEVTGTLLYNVMLRCTDCYLIHRNTLSCVAPVRVVPLRFVIRGSAGLRSLFAFCNPGWRARSYRILQSKVALCNPMSLRAGVFG